MLRNRGEGGALHIVMKRGKNPASISQTAIEMIWNAGCVYVNTGIYYLCGMALRQLFAVRNPETHDAGHQVCRHPDFIIS
jgi:hypothetical protein